MKILGQNLKKARIQVGLTQKEVESKLGLRDFSIKDFESGRLKLPIDMAAKFAELYKLRDFFGLLSTPSFSKEII
jgi:cytoskeletal protein RodZ